MTTRVRRRRRADSTQVHVGYLGTAYLVILILTGHYLIAFDPCKSPFKTADRVTFPSDDLGNGLIEQKWRPNQIDVSCLGLLRWPFPGRTRDERKPESQLRVAIHTVCVWIYRIKRA